MNNFIFWYETSFSYFSDNLLQMKSFCKNLSRKMKKEIVLRKLLDLLYNNNYLLVEGKAEDSRKKLTLIFHLIFPV